MLGYLAGFPFGRVMCIVDAAVVTVRAGLEAELGNVGGFVQAYLCAEGGVGAGKFGGEVDFVALGEGELGSGGRVVFVDGDAVEGLAGGVFKTAARVRVEG